MTPEHVARAVAAEDEVEWVALHMAGVALARQVQGRSDPDRAFESEWHGWWSRWEPAYRDLAMSALSAHAAWPGNPTRGRA